MKKRGAALLAVLMFFTMLPIASVPAYAANDKNVIVSVPWEKINKCGHQPLFSPYCQAFSWAYCRIILDNTDYTYRDYWVDGVGGVAPTVAGYNDYKKFSSQSEMLKTVYDNINIGRPVVIQVQGTPGNVHFVVAIGYRRGANRENLTPRDILILDPANSATNVTAGANETYTYLDSCTLTGYACWTAKYGGTKVTNAASNGVTATPSVKPQPPSATMESGEWDAYIPANYKLLLYGSETAANSITYVSARASSYRVVCSKKATLSNGIVRYYGAFNANDHYWLTYTNGMTIENADATKVHTVNFNANGGSVSTSHKQVTAGGIYGDLPTPTRSGYNFDGWYTAVSGGVQVISSTTVNLSNTQVTLYAHWTQNALNLSVRSTEQGNWRITLPDEGVPLYDSILSTSKSGQYNYKAIDCYQKAILSDGSIRYCAKLNFSEGEKSRWIVFSNNMSVEDYGNPSARVVKYVNCYSQIACASGTVNLYKKPGDTTRYDYFSNGQSTGSSTYALMSDGSKWYQVYVSSNGASMDLWLRGDNSISVTTRHTYGDIQYEKAHPHKGYQMCECGQKAYTGTNGKADSCADCDKVRVTLDLGTIGPKVPAESITVTNGYRYLYIYKPTGEVIKQIGGDVYEVHMIPGSTYQLNTVVTPSNTTDRIQYSIRLPSNNPSNGGGVSVSNTGLISADDTAHGSTIVEITCGNCKTEVYIIMCTSTGERL